MMNYAGFTVKKRQEMWCEAAQTAKMLDNDSTRKSTSYEILW